MFPPPATLPSVGLATPPGSDMVPCAGLLSYGPLSDMVNVMLFPLMATGTGTQAPPTSLKYWDCGCSGTGDDTVIVSEVAGANPVTFHEKNPSGEEPGGGGVARAWPVTGSSAVNPPLPDEKVTCPVPDGPGMVTVGAA